MNNRIRQKLRSQKGASITFALLLFMVCAVLSSVLLTAATAAAGRMSRIAELDQRYYAVTSASGFLRGILEEKPVSFVKVENEAVEITYTDGVPGSPASADPEEDGKSGLYMVHKAADEVTDADLTEESRIEEDTPPGTDSMLDNTAYRYYRAVLLGEGTENVIPEYELSLDSASLGAEAGDAADSAAVTIRGTLAEDGSLVFYISNRDADRQGRRYTLAMTFSTERKQNSDRKTTRGEPSAPQLSEGGKVTYTVREQTKTRETESIAWHLAGMENVSPESGGTGSGS